MFQVRKMSEQDFAFAVQITDEMNWNMVQDDFKFMMKLEPQGCFVLSSGPERVGIATTVSFGKIGWFGNLIVAESQRKKGAGSSLVEHSIKYLKSKGVETVGLYAYIDKVSFYKRLGFEVDSEFVVLKGEGFSSGKIAGIVKAKRKNIEEIVSCDSFCFGASRRKVLEPILHDRDNLGYIYIGKERMLGFALAKVWGSMADLGPLVCLQGRDDVAMSLLGAILNQLNGSEVSLCVPKKEKSLLDMLMRGGFAPSFHVARMFYHPSNINSCVYAAESLERG
jgi:predicted GNAT family acetyltransferase